MSTNFKYLISFYFSFFILRGLEYQIVGSSTVTNIKELMTRL